MKKFLVTIINEEGSFQRYVHADNEEAALERVALYHHIAFPHIDFYRYSIREVQ